MEIDLGPYIAGILVALLVAGLVIHIKGKKVFDDEMQRLSEKEQKEQDYQHRPRK